MLEVDFRFKKRLNKLKKKRLNNEIDVSFFILVGKTCQPPFRGWLITATTSRNHAAISQKEAIESPEMERFWLIEYIFANKGGKIAVTRFENSMSYPYRVSGRISISIF